MNYPVELLAYINLRFTLIGGNTILEQHRNVEAVFLREISGQVVRGCVEKPISIIAVDFIKHLLALVFSQRMPVHITE